VDRADGSRDAYPGLSDDIPINEGDVIEVITTGGGGWGDPFARDAERVRLDVVRGVVSNAAAREQYGVVLADDWDRDVDVAATQELRASLRSMRGEARMFDRGPYFEALRAAGRVPRPAGWPDPDGDS
jgi:N-methylhydantoinase B